LIGWIQDPSISVWVENSKSWPMETMRPFAFCGPPLDVTSFVGKTKGLSINGLCPGPPFELHLNVAADCLIPKWPIRKYELSLVC
jgi:hypothetical protein